MFWVIDHHFLVTFSYVANHNNSTEKEEEEEMIFLHMTNAGIRNPGLLILSPTPYPLGHMLLKRWSGHFMDAA